MCIPKTQSSRNKMVIVVWKEEGIWVILRRLTFIIIFNIIWYFHVFLWYDENLKVWDQWWVEKVSEQRGIWTGSLLETVKVILVNIIPGQEVIKMRKLMWSIQLRGPRTEARIPRFRAEGKRESWEQDLDPPATAKGVPVLPSTDRVNGMAPYTWATLLLLLLFLLD